MEAQLFQYLTTDVVSNCKYINPKLNMYGDKIAVKYHDGKEVPYDKHCEATGLLRIASVYNQGINYWPQVYLDECKYEEVENHGVLLLSDDEDDSVF